jgi:hypothetical protein
VSKDVKELFPPGQSVAVKIMEIKEDVGRFLCSLRLSDCFHDNLDIGVELLETYLNERDHFLDAVMDEKGYFFFLQNKNITH